MPFAYAGTRRRRNRDRRRTHDSQETSTAQQERESTRPADAREERDPMAARCASDEERANDRKTGRGEMSSGAGGEESLEPGGRDPDAPPVDNRS